MKVLTARVIVESSELLELVTDEGTAYVVEPKPRFLEYFAVLTGSDVFSGKIKTEEGIYPRNPDDGRLEPMHFRHVTTDAVVLELARSFAAGELSNGKPIAIPTFDTADAAQWDFSDADRGLIRRAK